MTPGEVKKKLQKDEYGLYMSLPTYTKTRANIDNFHKERCPECKGKGYKTPEPIHSIKCSTCNGTGKSNLD